MLNGVNSRQNRTLHSLPSPCAMSCDMHPKILSVCTTASNSFLAEFVEQIHHDGHRQYAPVAVTLITSDPYFTACLTAFRASKGAVYNSFLSGPGHPIRSLADSVVGSAWSTCGADRLSGGYRFVALLPLTASIAFLRAIFHSRAT